MPLVGTRAVFNVLKSSCSRPTNCGLSSLGKMVPHRNHPGTRHAPPYLGITLRMTCDCCWEGENGKRYSCISVDLLLCIILDLTDCNLVGPVRAALIVLCNPGENLQCLRKCLHKASQHDSEVATVPPGKTIDLEAEFIQQKTLHSSPCASKVPSTSRTSLYGG